MHTTSGDVQSARLICGVMRTSFAAINDSVCADAMTGRITPVPVCPSVMSRQSRPADMNMSYKPNTTEAADSCDARMAMLTGGHHRGNGVQRKQRARV